MVRVVQMAVRVCVRQGGMGMTVACLLHVVGRWMWRVSAVTQWLLQMVAAAQAQARFWMQLVSAAVQALWMRVVCVTEAPSVWMRLGSAALGWWLLLATAVMAMLMRVVCVLVTAPLVVCVVL
jgi:hypothetical protein